MIKICDIVTDTVIFGNFILRNLPCLTVLKNDIDL